MISNITDTNKRSQNEDNYFHALKYVKGKRIIIAAVFDGMGGTDLGEKASEMAKSSVENFFINNSINCTKWFPDELKNKLSELILDINKNIYIYGKENNVSLGTTAVLMVIYDNEYLLANVGDSRAYKFSAKSIQLTKDQTLAQREIDKGNLTKEEALTDKRSHVLTQALGYLEPPEIGFYKGKLKNKDYILLCSDGMYNRIPIQEMAEIIKNTTLDGQDKLIELAVTAKKKGEKDNITGILIEI